MRPNPETDDSQLPQADETAYLEEEARIEAERAERLSRRQETVKESDSEYITWVAADTTRCLVCDGPIGPGGVITCSDACELELARLLGGAPRGT